MVTPPTPPITFLAMGFAERLATTRRQRELTQDQLAERVGVHVSQIRRYEAGSTAPTLEVLKNLALALSISTDTLVFDLDERGPDEELRLALEAAQHLTPHEREHLLAVAEGLLLRHQARTLRLTS